jgi:hypothetical protein
MPIKPQNKARYPKNWAEIREKIRQRANNKCEWCGIHNHSIGARDKNNQWHTEQEIDNMNSDVGFDLFGDYPNIIKIVCTTAHLDHTPENCDDSNLAFLCQKCHNNYDKGHRKQTVRENHLVGQLKLDVTFE